jgi:hypothetical protein
MRQNEGLPARGTCPNSPNCCFTILLEASSQREGNDLTLSLTLHRCLPGTLRLKHELMRYTY